MINSLNSVKFNFNMETNKIIKAGNIVKEVKIFAKSFIKKDMLLLDIAEKIEDKIFELGGKPAFPTNLSINEVAAHYTPAYDSKDIASGLLKVDFGVHIDGWTADNAFSIDLENTQENKKLIKAAEEGLAAATNAIKEGVTTSQIGSAIQNAVEKAGANPIINLSGHSMEQYDLHAGITIPNVDDNKEIKIEKGLYAIEPFTTLGSGKVHDGKPSTIYQLMENKNTRSPIAREILNHIIEKYETLPFCSRWLVKEFGTKALVGLKQLEEQGVLHHYPQLIESSKAKVAQAENTFLVEEKVTITTE